MPRYDRCLFWCPVLCKSFCGLFVIVVVLFCFFFRLLFTQASPSLGGGHGPSLSVRDLLSWAGFITSALDRNATSSSQILPGVGDGTVSPSTPSQFSAQEVVGTRRLLRPWEAYVHGAALVLVDGMGLGAGVSPASVSRLRKASCAVLAEQVGVYTCGDHSSTELFVFRASSFFLRYGAVYGSVWEKGELGPDATILNGICGTLPLTWTCFSGTLLCRTAPRSLFRWHIFGVLLVVKNYSISNERIYHFPALIARVIIDFYWRSDSTMPGAGVGTSAAGERR